MLSPTQRAVAAVLLSGELVPVERLVIAIYGGRRDGGPLDADLEVYKQIAKLRDKLARFGIEIETVGRGRGAMGYRVRSEYKSAIETLLVFG